MKENKEEKIRRLNEALDGIRPTYVEQAAKALPTEEAATSGAKKAVLKWVLFAAAALAIVASLFAISIMNSVLTSRLGPPAGTSVPAGTVSGAITESPTTTTPAVSSAPEATTAAEQLPQTPEGYSQGLFYTRASDGKAWIVSGMGSCKDMDIRIPEKLGDLAVTEIGPRAFATFEEFSEIVLPDSVKTIGTYAFQGCRNLSRFTVPEGVTTIAEGTFTDCVSLNEIWLPSSVTSIEKGAFVRCYSLSLVHFSVGLKTIEENAFSDCIALYVVKIPDGVTDIGESAFSCSGLPRLTLPTSVTHIGKKAFYGCFCLNEITYLGTVEQWNAIEKGEDWNAEAGQCVVRCTDGILTKEQS